MPSHTMAAPVDTTDRASTSSKSSVHPRRPKWVNPCGIDAAQLAAGPHGPHELEIKASSDADIFNQIITQSNIALAHANGFKVDFLRAVFGDSYEEAASQWADMPVDWLPNARDIPKEIGGRLQDAHLENLEVTESLRRTYEYLQKYAVGLEQVVLDRALNQDDFTEEFRATQELLTKVLCELQVAMLEKSIEPNDDVTRAIMEAEAREEPRRNLRDWLILRDYINGLEYIAQVFGHFLSSSN